MTPTERAAVLLELKRFPMIPRSVHTWGTYHIAHQEPAPQAKFDAFADYIWEMYTKFGRPSPSGGVIFQRSTTKMIRRREEHSFVRAMEFAVRDLGRAEQLLATKLLIFT